MELNYSAVDNCKSAVEENSKVLDVNVNSIISPFCKDLDSYVMFVSKLLKNGENPPTNAELEDCCLNLSTLIYFAAGACETLGIRDDLSKSRYKETYHTARASIDKGTVADKDSIAELSSQSELLTNMCYNRAYKLMKGKVDAAQELLSSCKKVLSHRMLELEISRIGE